MPSIVLIGTEGSGKTVLTTVLAKYFHHRPDLGCLLDPQTLQTTEFMSQNWDSLRNGEWPASTPLGAKVDLRWKFQMKGLPPFDVHVADCSGQNFRDLFGAEKVRNRQPLPEALREVADFCEQAEIIIILVNLRDFMGDPDSKRRIETEWTIKLSLQALVGQLDKQVAIVFTQADLYPEIPNNGGASTASEQHWLRLAERHLPIVYAAYLANKKVKLFAVAAVNKTRVIHDGASARRVPDPEFKSEGLDEVGAWIFERAKEITYPSLGKRIRRLVSTSGSIMASAFTFSSSASSPAKGDTDHEH